MGLEATIVVLDNSKYAINGDILPSRFDAQTDALSLLAGSKLDENLESAVGLMTMGGQNVEVLLTPIREKGPIMACVNKIEVSGDSNLSRAIQIASLSLKHRANKNQRQRIIAMVASPLSETVKELEAIGKKLKKNQIAIDIVNLGEPGNLEKINALVGAANNEDNSHTINVEPSITSLSDILSNSAIIGRVFMGENMGGAGEGMDDDIQVAIRISLEEEQRRIAEEQRKAEEEQRGGARQAQTGEPMAAEGRAPTQDQEHTELEKDLIRKAKEMSINPKEGSHPEGAGAQLFEDPDFIKDVLKDLEIDPEGQDAKAMIEQMTKDSKTAPKDDHEKKDDKGVSKNKMDEEKKE